MPCAVIVDSQGSADPSFGNPDLNKLDKCKLKRS